MISQSFFPKITLPTRLGTQSSTLIDNIFSKVSPTMLDSKSGIIVSALSDHFPVFISTDRMNSCSIKPPNYVKIRVNSIDSKQKLLNELIDIDIYSKMDKNLCESPNSNYKILEKELQKCKEKHMPIKVVKYNKHKHKKNAWITMEL